jgi:CPA2 family monovalent cation:H+ antiporter-2
LWKLFSDPSILLLMALLLVAFFAAKVVPALWIQRWYGWRTAFSIGFLVSAKLTLVIAAVRVGEELHLMPTRMASAIILVAVISCLIGPVLFKKLFPKQHMEEKKTKVVIIGANQITLPLSLEMDDRSFETTVFHSAQEKIESPRAHKSSFIVKELSDINVETVKAAGAFDTDILVAATGDDKVNARIAEDAKDHVNDRAIARIETADLSEKLRNKGIETFSSFFSTKAILKAMIESPDVVDILTKEESGLYEVEMHNPEFIGVDLRRFPHLGDTIIVRIFRDNNSIVPHGDTELEMDDRLIVTGSKVYVDKLEELLNG